MSNHKDRLKAQLNKPAHSRPRSHSNYTSHQNSRINFTNSVNRKSEYSLTDEEDGSIPVSPVYVNIPGNKDRRTKSAERLPDHYYNSKPSLAKSRNTTMTYNGTSKPHIPLDGSNSELVYKSQSLHALQAKEPNKVLLKSSIQQEYHDRMVQKHLKGVHYGHARRPCLIATIMIVLFVLFFTIGLTLICLTYIYKNITFSLDKGEAIGPVLLAGSFVFFGVGVKYLYDAHRISRMEKNTVKYECYDHRYVGLKNTKINNKANEMLVSGSATQAGLSRVPNKVHTMPRGLGGNSTMMTNSKINYKADDSEI